MIGFGEKKILLFDELISEIDKHEFISFDIFDTALIRNVLNPVDIFDIVEMRLNTKYKIKNFKSIRIKSEQLAREHSHSEDITIYEIYNEISKKISASIAKEALECELATERTLIISNHMIKKAYNYANENNKQVMFISDMYLPKEFVIDILATNGYEHDHRIYMSGEIGKGKYTGSLYSYVQKDIDIPESRWLHIGDNIQSDFNMPRKYNIHALHYVGPRFVPPVPARYTLKYSIATAIQINACYQNMESYWKRFGIVNVSPLVWGFVNWICNDLRNKDIENIYFLSRDGYLPFKVYESMRRTLGDLPKAHYIYSSRRAYLFGLINNLQKEEAINVLTLHNRQLGQSLSLNDIFNNVGLDINSYENIIKESGLSDETVLDNYTDIKKIKNLLLYIYNDIVASLETEQQNLIKYLKENIAGGDAPIYIVDIGWKGSVAHAIHILMNRDIHGYFLGVSDDAYPEIKSNIKGYIFKPRKNKKLKSFIANNVMMMEFALSAPQGSLIKFDSAGDPILVDMENNNSVKRATQEVCEAVESICNEYMIYYDYLKNMPSEDAFYNYKKFIQHKEIGDLNEFYELSAVVGLGESQKVCSYVTKTTIENYNRFQKEIILQGKKNLWRDAVIIEGNITHLRRGFNFGKMYQNDFLRKIIQSKMVRGLMNPRRALEYLMRKE